VKFKEKCENFNETNCFTKNNEVCSTVKYNNCSGVIKTSVERSCFNVTELMCNLVEHVHYQTMRDYYQVQRCLTVQDRICDTVYVMEHRNEDSFQCVELDSPDCYMEEVVIHDVTCTDSVEFECKSYKSDSIGELFPEYKLTDLPRHLCERQPTKQCNHIPRKVQVERCKPIMYKYCEKLTNLIPVPHEEQNCHFVQKKICEVEDKMRVKKGKKYSYSKDCDQVPREVCDQVEKKIIEPVCSEEERLDCRYVPEEQCQTNSKEYCYKYEDIVFEEVCDDKVKTSFL